MSEEGFELEYVREAFETNWIAPLGPNVDAFEKELAARVGVSHAAALVSGTAAIHLALKAAGVGPGDTVICQSLTFSASANPIVYQNAAPVFVDSDEKTWNMDPAQLEEALKIYPAAKAVIVVNLYGLAADLDPIVRICKEHGVALIEDAAESLGTLYKGRYTGTFGDYGVYSFNGNKIITSSGGGMLVSENGAMIEKARFWATQARDKARHYQHSELGYNYRMSNVVAGIGRGQLKVLERRIARKKEIFAFYRRELEGLDGLSFMPVNDFNEPNYWLTCIQLKGSVRPLDVMETLEADNIESRPIWKPLHLQPFFAGCGSVGGDTARGIFENGLCLPSGTNLSDEDLERVAGVIKKIWRAV